MGGKRLLVNNQPITQRKKKKDNAIVNASISHDVLLSNIFPMMPKRAFETAVMKAIKARNLANLRLLLGCTPATVPTFLTQDLKYARAAGFSILLPVLQRLGFKLSKHIFEAAVKQNNLNILIWLKQKNCPWDEYTFALAAEYGNLVILKWLKENGCP
jgi:hypothetical protein